MRIRIVRLEMSKQGALGVLLMDDVIFCFTLEPDITEKRKLYIQQGVYHCQRFHGTRWKDTFEILVPGHTAVLFHAGNTEADTQMCILLGSTIGKLKGNRAVLNSGISFSSFMKKMGDDQEAVLFIEDRYA